MIESITISPQRSIGSIEVDCTIREQSTDRYTPTRHPVEQGAQISDHIIREPSQLSLEIGFSNSSLQAAGNEGYVIQKYEELLQLQATREPISVVTGKRTYSNMAITSLGVTTDQETEAVLACNVTLEEIIIAHTQTTTVPASSVQSNPQKTAAVVEKGTVQPRPAALSPTGD